MSKVFSFSPGSSRRGVFRTGILALDQSRTKLPPSQKSSSPGADSDVLGSQQLCRLRDGGNAAKQRGLVSKQQHHGNKHHGNQRHDNHVLREWTYSEFHNSISNNVSIFTLVLFLSTRTIGRKHECGSDMIGCPAPEWLRLIG